MHELEDRFALFALQSHVDKLFRGKRPDVLGDPFDPGVQSVGRVSCACDLRLVCKLPCHDCGVVIVLAAVHRVCSLDDRLDVIFVPER
jgi:hypothetical protein